MPRETSLISMQRRAHELRQKYLDDVDHYLKRIKDVVKEVDPDSRVMVFGSYVKDTMRVDSDVDVLIITHLAEDTGDRIKLRVAIAEDIGVYSPFEFHIATMKEYMNWYRKFIDEYREINTP